MEHLIFIFKSAEYHATGFADEGLVLQLSPFEFYLFTKNYAKTNTTKTQYIKSGLTSKLRHRSFHKVKRGP